MKKSRLGQLMEKYDKSGIDSNPIISTQELKILLELIKELSLVSEDLKDFPLKYMMDREVDRLESIIENRNERTNYRK